jgi:hypothetical protein
MRILHSAPAFCTNAVRLADGATQRSFAKEMPYGVLKRRAIYTIQQPNKKACFLLWNSVKWAFRAQYF